MLDHCFEFLSAESLNAFTPEGCQLSWKDGVMDWPLCGSLTSVFLDVKPGHPYSMRLPLRNTLCVRMKNDSPASELRVSFITDKEPFYTENKAKVFAITPHSDWLTCYFNLSDCEGAEGYLRGFRFETPDSREGLISIRAISFEREKMLRPYAGKVVSCVADGETVTVEGTLLPEYCGRKVELYETNMSNYDASLSRSVKIAETTANGDRFTVKIPFMKGNMTRLSSHFIAVCGGIYVDEWFVIQNYYTFSSNPYAFDLELVQDVRVTDEPFCALGDGFTDDTDAIQKAIDQVAAAGGGRVTIPGDGSEYGKRYVITTLTVHSNIWLYIEKNAVLWQSPRETDYRYQVARGHDVVLEGINWTHAGYVHNYPLILVKNATHFRISGQGSLRLNDDGSECDDGLDGGTIWIGCQHRIHLITMAIVESSYGEVRDVTFQRANCYHLPQMHSDHLYFANVTMHEVTCASGDGFSQGIGTHHVKIDRCFMRTNDDAVIFSSSYNEPRGLVWWRAHPQDDNSVHHISIVHSDLLGGHGLCFITWGTDNPDLSRQEARDLEAYDNVMGGGWSVGSWCDNPYYGKVPFDNSETDDYSPVRDVRFFRNRYDNICTVWPLKITHFLSDCGISSAKDFEYGDFERPLGQKGWIAGLSNWSVLGDREKDVRFCRAGDNHFARVTGNTRLYQGLSVEASDVTFRFDAALSGGNAWGFIADAYSGATVLETRLTVSEEFRPVVMTACLRPGEYCFGVRTEEGASLSVDNFRLTQAGEPRPDLPAPTGGIVPEFVFHDDVLPEFRK